jgi:ATP-dependent Lon protease
LAHNSAWTGVRRCVSIIVEEFAIAPSDCAGLALLGRSCRRALIDLSDEAAAKVQTIFYLDPGDALRKALHDG